ASGGRHVETYSPLRCEFECIREQVFEHLLQALGIREDTATETCIDLHVERETLALGFVIEGALDDVDEGAERCLFGVDSHGARLDFRQVQNVGDEVEQVGPCAVNRAGELDL